MNLDGSSTGHRLPGVEKDIVQYLADLARIDLGSPEIFGHRNLDADRGSGTGKLHRVGDEFGDRNHAPYGSSTFGKSQQLRG